MCMRVSRSLRFLHFFFFLVSGNEKVYPGRLGDFCWNIKKKLYDNEKPNLRMSGMGIYYIHVAKMAVLYNLHKE